MITRSLHNTSEATDLVFSVFIGVLDCWHHFLCIRFGLTGGLGGEFFRDVLDLCVLSVFRVLVVDGDDAGLLLDEEELRFDVVEFDLNCCFS